MGARHSAILWGAAAVAAQAVLKVDHACNEPWIACLAPVFACRIVRRLNALECWTLKSALLEMVTLSAGSCHVCLDLGGVDSSLGKCTWTCCARFYANTQKVAVYRLPQR